MSKSNALEAATRECAGKADQRSISILYIQSVSIPWSLLLQLEMGASDISINIE